MRVAELGVGAEGLLMGCLALVPALLGSIVAYLTTEGETQTTKTIEIFLFSLFLFVQVVSSRFHLSFYFNSRLAQTPSCYSI